MKYLGILFLSLFIVGVAAYLYQQAITQSTYEGLPTVPCLDYTKPVVQQFSFTITINVNKKPYPISPSIGHDYGNCLHDIFVNDASGKVYIKANDNEQFTLGQFFDVWHKTFTPIQLFQYQTGNSHVISVIVNGKKVEDYRNLLLKPNQQISVIYK